MNDAAEFRSGFVCLVGRPNTGKSTLLNALVGRQVAIVSDKPQTTRHAIRGIINRPGSQLVMIDTPGLSKPRALLQTRLNDLVAETLSDVDIIGVCLPADQRLGPGDQRIIEQLAGLAPRPPLVALATKADRVIPLLRRGGGGADGVVEDGWQQNRRGGGERLSEHLLSIDAAGAAAGIEWAHIVPCSGVTGWQVDEVRDVLGSLLAPGPRFYPGDEVTDEPSDVMIAELIREAALELVRDELPHSITVEVMEINERPDRPVDKPLWDIFANLVVERDSQKHIVIGRGGEMIREIGTAARLRINALLSMRVHLDLRVKVMENWQRDPKKLARLGF
ncbi:MAG: GTPase Era [Propionibacteriaceae bacterium]|nr:GTPase Era [Propionibacteriaceae bacterium]